MFNECEFVLYSDKGSYVYLIHFNEPLAHSNHYIGYTNNLEKRMDRHARDDGAKILKILKEKGIGWKVVKVWVGGDRKLEKRLKNRGGASRICPICRRKK